MGQILVQSDALDRLVSGWLTELTALVADDLVIIGIRTGGDALAGGLGLGLRRLPHSRAVRASAPSRSGQSCDDDDAACTGLDMPTRSIRDASSSSA